MKQEVEFDTELFDVLPNQIAAVHGGTLGKNASPASAPAETNLGHYVNLVDPGGGPTSDHVRD
jgi:hypothetical protein